MVTFGNRHLQKTKTKKSVINKSDIKSYQRIYTGMKRGMKEKVEL